MVLGMALEAQEEVQEVQEGPEEVQEVLGEAQEVQEVQEVPRCQGTIWTAPAQFLCLTCRHSHHQLLSQLEGASLSPPNFKAVQ